MRTFIFKINILLFFVNPIQRTVQYMINTNHINEIEKNTGAVLSEKGGFAAPLPPPSNQDSKRLPSSPSGSDGPDNKHSIQ